MTEDRFRHLASAYGADLARWPKAERAAAAEFLARHADVAGRMLAAEQPLDDTLAADAVAEPRPALRARIIEAAPRQRAAGRAMRWLTAAGLGLGLAASCAAGVAAGFSLTPHSVVHMIGGHSDEAAEGSSLADPLGDAADS
ncbi:MAG TPA: hypothetical protein VHW60_23575 [Caulobacteraceae bacterium]|jgi:hypothetical protein|nr:hypothetical protein [Caulobacteraceae bacterium]